MSSLQRLALKSVPHFLAIIAAETLTNTKPQKIKIINNQGSSYVSSKGVAASVALVLGGVALYALRKSNKTSKPKGIAP